MDETGFVVTLILQLILFGHLIAALFARVQARTLELMLTFVLMTLPMGMLLSQDRYQLEERIDFERTLVIGLFPTLLILSGSIWGLSVAQRLNESNVWRSWRFMLLGWIAFPCLLVPIAASDYIGGELRSMPDAGRRVLIALIIGISAFPLLLGLQFEYLCDLKQSRSGYFGWAFEGLASMKKHEAALILLPMILTSSLLVDLDLTTYRYSVRSLVNFVPSSMLALESLWALSALQRLHEQRPWTRASVILMSWLIVPGCVLAVSPVVYLNFSFFTHTGGHLWPAVFYLAGLIPLVFAVLIERRDSR
jgi:hypothetical protein